MDTNIITLQGLGGAIDIEVRQSPKAKNISIQINLGKAELVLPYRASEKVWRKFLLSKESWIRSKLREDSERPIKRKIHDAYPMLDQVYKLEHISVASKFSVLIDGENIIARSKEERLFEALTTFFKNRALWEVAGLVKFLAQKHGFQYNKISVRDMKTKWGSCSSSKNLSFNWRIIFAPSHVLHYLVSHELCHLKEMNHSARFWKLVAQLAPNYKTSQAWLTKHGGGLHYYLVD